MPLPFASILSVPLVAALCLSTIASAQAATHYFNYSFDGTQSFVNQTAAGSALEVGDTVEATFNAINGYWLPKTGDYIWTPQELTTSGSRIGDLTYSLFLNGSLVDDGQVDGETSEFIHIPQNFYPQPVAFDKLVWVYTLTSSTNPAEFNGGTFGYGASLRDGDQGPDFIASVPEPHTYALALAGIALVGLTARKRRNG